jgi:hypothetical protein
MFSIGVDLGQRRDFSAVAVIQRVPSRAPAFDALAWRPAEPPEAHWLVRHLERLPLGTPYTEVAARVVAIARHPQLRGRCQLVVDATGVGLPVVEMLRAARPECAIAAVWITGGNAERFDGKLWRVPKLDLLARVQTLLEQKRLRIASGMREAGTLVRELLNIASVRRPAGSLQIGARGAEEHDDLTLAVALALWAGRRPQAGEQGRRLPCA